MTGYEISGFDKIPDEGPALLVYYHGALPIDLYYLMANVILHKRRCLRAVGDRFLFIIPGFLFTLLVMTSFCLCCILYKLSLFCGTLQNIVIVGFIQNYSAYFLFLLFLLYQNTFQVNLSCQNVKLHKGNRLRTTSPVSCCLPVQLSHRFSAAAEVVAVPAGEAQHHIQDRGGDPQGADNIHATIPP